MAAVEIKKLRLLGLKSEEDTILNILQQTKSVELKKTGEFDGLNKGLFNSTDDLSQKISRLSLAINLIEDSIKEKQKYKLEEEEEKQKKPFFSARTNVSFDDFTLISAREYEIFSLVEELEGYNARLSQIKSENAKQLNLIEQLKIYKSIDAPLNIFKDTGNTCIILGSIPSEAEKPLTEYFAAEENAIANFYNAGALTAAVIIFPLNDKEKHNTKLSSLGFTRVYFDYDKTAEEIIQNCRSQIDNLVMLKIAVLNDIIDLKTEIAEIKLLYDYYNLALTKKEHEKEFKSSAHVFILEGFVPVIYQDRVKESILAKTNNVVLEFENVAGEDNPPTYTKNSGFVAPFESVTNMYSVPHPDERDPNLFVGIFFFIFFGIMLSDAGYGILLAIGATILLRKARMEKGLKNILKIVALGGISTFIWGMLFGGWFAIELNENSGAVGQFLLSLRWFNPMEEPILMLGLCLGLGVVQILFGLGLRAAALIREGKRAEALMDIGSWYLFFAAVGVIAISMLPEFEMLADIGMYMLIASLAIIVLTQSRHGKGIFGKILKGIGGLYGIVGYLSDILSYARLFGLGLASGVVGLVMNTIAGMLLPNIFLAPIGVLVLIGGHTFNIAINVLGAYIHNCRLQYIEFFSRFYKGGGHIFMPYGTNLKYFNVK